MARRLTVRTLKRALLVVLVSVVLVEIVLQVAHLFTGGRPRPPEAGDGAPATVLCLGDSHTYGVFLDEPQTYPALLEERLKGAGHEIEVVNLGAPGLNSSQLRRRLPAWLETYRPAAVIVLVSVNNSWNRGDAAWSDAVDGRPVSFASRLADLLRTRVRIVRGIDVLLHGLEWVGAPTGTGRDRQGELVLHDPAASGSLPADENQDRITRDLTDIVMQIRAAGAVPILMTYVSPTGENFVLPNRLLRLNAALFGVELADNDRAVRRRLGGATGALDAATRARLFFPDLHLTAEGCAQVAENVHRSLERSRALAGLRGTPQPATPDDLAAARDAVLALAHAATNTLSPFVPRLTQYDRCVNECRHVPMIRASAPWHADGVVPLEVPEYVWGRIARESEARNQSPLFYGRALERASLHGWIPRFATQSPPAWTSGPDGVLALDSALAGGHVVRFRVVPHDRVLEIRFGFTAGPGAPVTELRAQLCTKGWGLPELAERHPTSSWMVSGQELITWDAAGQSLAWIDAAREPGTERFRHSCHFTAQVTAGAVTGRRFEPHGMRLGRGLDLPAIAKANRARDRAVVVYSPTARDVAYNVLEPCFHADPYLGTVRPGETRWTQTFVIFLAGDVERFLHELGALHRSRAPESSLHP